MIKAGYRLLYTVARSIVYIHQMIIVRSLMKCRQFLFEDSSEVRRVGTVRGKLMLSQDGGPITQKYVCGVPILRSARCWSELGHSCGVDPLAGVAMEKHCMNRRSSQRTVG